MRTENGYQFAHIEWSARAANKQKSTHKNGRMQTRSGGWSAQDIANEAERVQGACNHVQSPQAPGLLYGVMPSEAVKMAEKWSEKQLSSYEKTLKDGSKKTITRAYRDDAPIMANGVISLPREREADWDSFKADCVNWLKNEYGERLKSVVEHLDEEHPHLHFYCVANANEDFGAVHAGYAARQAARASDGKSKSAYISAMQQWQDSFYDAVGSKYGLERIGPARQRVERDEALLMREKRNNEAQKSEIIEAYRQLNSDSSMLEKQNEEVVKKQSEIDNKEKKLNEREVALVAGIERLKAQQEKHKNAVKTLKNEKMQWQQPGAKISVLISGFGGADKKIAEAEKAANLKIKFERDNAKKAMDAVIAKAEKTAAEAEKEAAEARKQLANVMRAVPVYNALVSLGYEYDKEDQGFNTENGLIAEKDNGWFARDKRLRNAIDAVMHVRNVNAADAVDLIADACSDAPKLAGIPPKNEQNWHYVKKYLLERGINATVIERLKYRRLAYADDNKNCVFNLGKEHHNGVEIRGTNSNKKFHGTRGIKQCFHFPPAPDNCNRTVLVGESAIEACSLQSLYPNAYCVGTGGSNYEKAREELQALKSEGYKIMIESVNCCKSGGG